MWKETYIILEKKHIKRTNNPEDMLGIFHTNNMNQERTQIDIEKQLVNI